MTKNWSYDKENILNILKFPIHLKIANQISRILFRLIKIPAVIVKTASRKPK